MEDFSHIYDEQFASINMDKVILLQKFYRMFKWQTQFKMRLAQKRQKEIEEPPKYFTKEENEETIQKDRVVQYRKVDELVVEKPKYTYASGASYTG